MGVGNFPQRPTPSYLTGVVADFGQSQLPAIQTQLALDRKNPTEALNDLRAAAPPIEFGQMQFVANLPCLDDVYVRGEAYLAAGQSKG